MKSKLPRRTAALVTTMAMCAVLLVTGVTAAPSGAATVDPCGSGGNAVACENTKAGTPRVDVGHAEPEHAPSRASRPTPA